MKPLFKINWVALPRHIYGILWLSRNNGIFQDKKPQHKEVAGKAINLMIEHLNSKSLKLFFPQQLYALE